MLADRLPAAILKEEIALIETTTSLADGLLHDPMLKQEIALIDSRYFEGECSPLANREALTSPPADEVDRPVAPMLRSSTDFDSPEIIKVFRSLIAAELVGDESNADMEAQVEERMGQRIREELLRDTVQADEVQVIAEQDTHPAPKRLSWE